MSLDAPNLDDRRFQQLVDEAKRYVQLHCPEWTDHNVSDPGVTLIETFAMMVDQLIYRLNRVPERHYVKFLELIGVQLYPPTAARGTVTFRLSAPQPAPVLVRAETEVATVRTDLAEAVVFSTVADLSILPAELVAVVSAGPDRDAADLTETVLARNRAAPCFSARPRIGDCLLLGLSVAVPAHVVLLRFDSSVEGDGIDPTRPPLVWEAWNGQDWLPCEVERNTIAGFNKVGEVVLHVPASHREAQVAGRRAGWLRVRVVDADEETPAYRSTPQISRAAAVTTGATTGIVHAEAVHGEVLGRADGAPGGRFRVSRAPVVPWHQPDLLEVSDGDGWQTWSPVDDFAGSGPQDRHFRLDPMTGGIELGPAVRQPDGTVRQYGAVPPKDAVLRMATYRTGGGSAGNVGRGLIRILKTSVPFVSSVENRHPATGGTDGETLENAKVRGPLELRATGRAVTTGDFEELARAVAPDAARVHCLTQGGADAGVRLLVVPRAVQDDLGRVDPDDLESVPEELVRRIAEHLDRRRLVGTRLLVGPPPYQAVTVTARLRAAAEADHVRLQDEALRALHGYLSPLAGGPGGRGWPLGRPVQAFELYPLLDRLPGIALVEQLQLFPASRPRRDADALVTAEQADRPWTRGQPTTRIELPPDTLVLSYRHEVRVL